MAHNIFELDRPMYTRKPAWHGLGTVVADAPDSESAIRLGGLDWNVTTEKVFSSTGMEIPDCFATVRKDLPENDERRFLGTVGNRYAPIQNSEAFRFADALIGESGAKFESCGSLKNGRIVWLLADIPTDLDIVSDKLATYLLLRSSHDGSNALEALMTTIRVVCDNTLSVAIANSATKNRVKIRHTKSAKSNIHDARRVLGLAKDSFEEQANRFRIMAETKVDDRFTDAFVNALYPDTENRNNTRAAASRIDIKRLFSRTQAGASNAGIRDTAYGLYNALTEYLDHSASRVSTSKKSPREVQENRFTSILDGTVAKKRQQGFNLIGRAYGIDGNGAGLIEQVIEHNDTADQPTDITADDILAQIQI